MLNQIGIACKKEPLKQLIFCFYNFETVIRIINVAYVNRKKKKINIVKT